MFQNREEAGQLLADKLKDYKDNQNVIILAIPRGGVVVGKQFADKLHLPLSVIVVKKLGAPNNPELAIGAIASGGVRVVDWDLALRVGVEQEYLDKEIEDKKKEVEEREKKFGLPTGGLELIIKNKKIIILADDGVATGATVLAAIKYIKEKSKILPRRQAGKNQKSKIILSIPVIAKDTFDKLKSEVDKIIALETPEYFGAVGEFYREFPQVSDDEVIKLLK